MKMKRYLRIFCVSLCLPQGPLDMLVSPHRWDIYLKSKTCRNPEKEEEQDQEEESIRRRRRREKKNE